MLTLTAHNDSETATEKPIKTPFYLIELLFDAPVYLCTFKTVLLKGHVWSASRTISVTESKPETSGNQRATVTLSDLDNLISGLILSEDYAGKGANIYVGYGEPEDSDIVRKFAGVMDDAQINNSSVRLSLLGHGSVRMSPNIFIGKPDCNHLPPAGTVIKTGNVTITLNPGVR